MDKVIKELKERAKSNEDWARLDDMRGNHRQADRYRKNAKEYRDAITILSGGKLAATSDGQSNIPDVIKSVCPECGEKRMIMMCCVNRECSEYIP